MEEADRILIQTLKQIGCEFEPEVVQVDQIDQELFIECVAKLLNAINSHAPSHEALPSKLPPNTAVKFRICSKFASICQQLGYKGEVGYQTFLYVNEADMRRLLMFLVEKLNRESAAASDHIDKEPSPGSKTKTRNLCQACGQRAKQLLEELWIPPYCKLRSLRVQPNGKHLTEGCKCLVSFRTLPLAIPHGYSSSKENFSKSQQEYFETKCDYVTKQGINKRESVSVLASLMQLNKVQRIKEPDHLNVDDLHGEPKERKDQALNRFGAAIREELRLIEEAKNNQADGKSCLSLADLSEIEALVHLFDGKNLIVKGSRFTHTEKLQTAKDSEADATVEVPSSSLEEKKQEEINGLKETLSSLTEQLDQLESTVKKANKKIAKIEKETEAQVESNKALQEQIAVKQKSVHLIENAPENIEKLKTLIESHDGKMAGLEEKWEEYRHPLLAERDRLRQELVDRKQQMLFKVDEIQTMRAEIERLNQDLTEKDDYLSEINEEMKVYASKHESSEANKRQAYTKKILDIVANISKQKKEISKTLNETRLVQKEINQLSGKLERIFNSTDELIFKNARNDETIKKVYKLFVSINASYEELFKVLEETSHLERDIRDLEDQVDSDSLCKVEENMKMVRNDYKQIKEENEQLIERLAQ